METSVPYLDPTKFSRMHYTVLDQLNSYQSGILYIDFSTILSK
jgi:hypothetical protein